MKQKILNVLNSKLLFAVLLNGIALALFIIITSFSYDSVSDYTNSILISQNHFYYNNQINYILAMIVGTAQYVMPDFNCFVLAEIMLSWAAFCAITFVFADKFNKKRAFVFTVLFNIFFALEHYSYINGDKTSALLLIGGFLLVLNAIYNKRYSISCWFGVVMIAFGTFYNFWFFFVALGFAVAFFFGDLISKKKFRLPFRKFFWYFRPFLLMFLLVTAVAVGLHGFSYTINNATADAKSYYEYTTTLNEIDTSNYPQYSEIKNELAEAGMTSESEYNLLKSGYYDSEGTLNTDALRIVADYQQANSSRSVQTAVNEMLNDTLTHFTSFDCTAIIIIAFVGFGIAFVIFQKNRFGFFPIFYLVAGVASSIVMRYIYGSQSYISYGIWLFMMVMLFYSLNFENSRNNEMPTFFKFRYSNFIISCVVVLIIGTVFFATDSLHRQYGNRDNPQSMLSEIDRNPHKYYVFDTESVESFSVGTENYIHPLWGFRDGYLENTDSFSYLHNNEILIKRNLPTNIYKAVLTQREVYVVTKNDVADIQNYFAKNYAESGTQISFSETTELDGYKIYTVTQS